ncbi:MAG: putative MFS family arabinose efflux permease [Parasphingorhabdus sp.]|jgi:predicted MFS family arabinose efflux permease
MNRTTVFKLATAETLIWAISFYMFPAMFPYWEQDLGWDKTTLSGAFTMALLISAFASPIAGRLIDRGHGRLVLVVSTLLIAGGLLVLSFVSQLWHFYLAWALIGVAMAGGLYEACFAFVVWLAGVNAKRFITTITLVAGFAGAVSFPSVYWLTELIGWRNCLWVFAGVAVVIILPLFLSLPVKRQAPADSQEHDGHHTIGQAIRSPLFWLLAIGFSLIGLEHGMIISHLLPILYDRGIAAEHAVFYAACIGPMQVFGRLVMVVLQRRIDMVIIAMAGSLIMLLAVLALKFSIALTVLALLFVLLHGSSYGISSITRPVLTIEFLGSVNFGAISGLIGALYMTMIAIAPLLAAVIWSTSGYDWVLILSAVICMISFLCLFALSRKSMSQVSDR